MPYSTHWHQPQVVGYAELTGEVSFEDADETNAAISSIFLAEGEAPVHVIVNASKMTSFPRNVRMLNQSLNKHLKNPALGWLVFVSGFNNPFMNLLGKTVTQIAGIRFKFVNSMSEAEGFLRRLDERVVDNVQTES